MLTITVQPGENALQTAFDNLPRDDTPVTLHLAPGTYREKITLSRPNTTLEGEDASSTVILWDDGANEMMPDGLKRGTFRSYTMLMDADHVTLRRLSIVNAAAPPKMKSISPEMRQRR